MLTFRCTQKVRDLMGLPDGDLEEWFVETAMIERCRCLLFTHKVSLYSFWMRTGALPCAPRATRRSSGRCP